MSVSSDIIRTTGRKVEFHRRAEKWEYQKKTARADRYVRGFCLRTQGTSLHRAARAVAGLGSLYRGWGYAPQQTGEKRLSKTGGGATGDSDEPPM